MEFIKTFKSQEKHEISPTAFSYIDWYTNMGKSHLRLSMNQNINIKFFLELDNFVNFLLDGLNIFFLGDPKENNIDQAYIR